MKTAAYILALFIAGCAATPPQRLAGTQDSAPEQLAVLTVVADEVMILEADGQPVAGSGTGDFYLRPGSHVLKVDLHWCPGGLCTSLGAYADRPRTACIQVAAGSRYRVNASNPGPNWKPRVTEQKAGASPATLDAECH